MPKIFTDKEREVIQNKLLNAGIAQLEHKSYRNIAVSDIATEVGIAKGTFYNFFPSKEVFFYEIMQFIKERNRNSLKNLIRCNPPSKDEVTECLFQRYTQMKTVYDYFTPEEMKLIIRKLPNGDVENDSVEFAELLCGHLSEMDTGKAKVIVNMCNILALSSANRSMFEQEAYEKTIRVFCRAMTDYIFEGGKTNHDSFK